MDIFQRINAAGTTIVMATHDKTIVDQMQRRVIAIEKGKITRDEARGVYSEKPTKPLSPYDKIFYR